MRKTREILRLKWEVGLSHRQVAKSLGISPGAVGSTVSRAQKIGLDWATVAELSEENLELRLYGPPTPTHRDRPLPDFAHLHRELARPGVTLELLHIEYLQVHPTGYRYSRFCQLYKHWCKQQRTTLRHVHKAGEKLFLDYSGDKPHFLDPATGEAVHCELFVATLGASNYTFAEATRSQNSTDWIESHLRAFEFFRGVPKLLVPDNLKSAVTTPCRYEPLLQRTYEEMATHYGTAILPARPYKPRDKAKVESAVLVTQHWILAKMRNETCFSLEALNERIAELLAELNDRTMTAYGASRRQLFETLEHAHLLPLPAERFVFGRWQRVRVGSDYHVDLDGHAYSVPYSLVEQVLDARLTASTVEIFHQGQRVAAHRRSDRRGHHTTEPAHRPRAHREHLERSPESQKQWAQSVGPHTAAFVAAILESCAHPAQGLRSCQGLRHLGHRYGEARLEQACARAVQVQARSYRHVASILKNGLESLPLPGGESPPSVPVLPPHENLRGQAYYDTEE